LQDNFDTYVDSKNQTTTYYSATDLHVGAYSSSGTFVKRGSVRFFV